MDLERWVDRLMDWCCNGIEEIRGRVRFLFRRLFMRLSEKIVVMHEQRYVVKFSENYRFRLRRKSVRRLLNEGVR